MELFDLLEDPLELRSVDADPTMPRCCGSLSTCGTPIAPAKACRAGRRSRSRCRSAPDETTHLRVVMAEALRDYYG